VEVVMMETIVPLRMRVLAEFAQALRWTAMTATSVVNNIAMSPATAWREKGIVMTVIRVPSMGATPK